MRDLGQRAGHGPGHGQHVPAQVEGELRRDHGAAPRRALHDHGDRAQGGNDAVPGGEPPGSGRRPRRVLAHERAVPGDPLQEPPVRGGVGHVDARAEHGHRRPVGGERAAMRGLVDAACGPAHDAHARGGEAPTEGRGDLAPVRRAPPRPHDGGGRPVREGAPPHEQRRRGIRQVEQAPRVPPVPRDDQAGAAGFHRAQGLAAREAPQRVTTGVPHGAPLHRPAAGRRGPLRPRQRVEAPRGEAGVGQEEERLAVGGARGEPPRPPRRRLRRHPRPPGATPPGSPAPQGRGPSRRAPPHRGRRWCGQPSAPDRTPAR